LAWVAITVLLAVTSLWYGMNLNFGEPPHPQPQSAAPSPTPLASTDKPPVTNPDEKDKTNPQADSAQTQTSFVPGQSEGRSLTWLPLFPAILLVAVALRLLTRRPNEVIQDSPRFLEALEIWQPVIGKKCTTPRDFKRFLNRVRYIAM